MLDFIAPCNGIEGITKPRLVQISFDPCNAAAASHGNFIPMLAEEMKDFPAARLLRHIPGKNLIHTAAAFVLDHLSVRYMVVLFNDAIHHGTIRPADFIFERIRKHQAHLARDLIPDPLENKLRIKKSPVHIKNNSFYTNAPPALDFLKRLCLTFLNYIENGERIEIEE